MSKGLPGKLVKCVHLVPDTPDSEPGFSKCLRHRSRYLEVPLLVDGVALMMSFAGDSVATYVNKGPTFRGKYEPIGCVTSLVVIAAQVPTGSGLPLERLTRAPRHSLGMSVGWFIITSLNIDSPWQLPMATCATLFILNIANKLLRVEHCVLILMNRVQHALNNIFFS